MPNWCYGNVRISGNPKNIEKFCKLFLFDDVKTPKKYFARSFSCDHWKTLKKENLGNEFVEFGVNFAWSVHSCLIEGYPQEHKECITLVEACKKYKVDVVIDSEEGGMSFEEHIECNSSGDLIEKCYDMPIYECQCRNEQSFPSSYDISEEECYECEKIGKWRILKE